MLRPGWGAPPARGHLVAPIRRLAFVGAGAMGGAMIRGALAAGLVPAEEIGSGLMARDLKSHPADLRNMVTSPGGTTAAGLSQLEAGALRAAVDRAVVAAYERSRAL